MNVTPDDLRYMRGEVRWRILSGARFDDRETFGSLLELLNLPEYDLKYDWDHNIMLEPDDAQSLVRVAQFWGGLNSDLFSFRFLCRNRTALQMIRQLSGGLGEVEQRSTDLEGVNCLDQEELDVIRHSLLEHPERIANRYTHSLLFKDHHQYHHRLTGEDGAKEEEAEMGVDFLDCLEYAPRRGHRDPKPLTKLSAALKGTEGLPSWRRVYFDTKALLYKLLSRGGSGVRAFWLVKLFKFMIMQGFEAAADQPDNAPRGWLDAPNVAFLLNDLFAEYAVESLAPCVLQELLDLLEEHQLWLDRDCLEKYPAVERGLQALVGRQPTLPILFEANLSVFTRAWRTALYRRPALPVRAPFVPDLQLSFREILQWWASGGHDGAILVHPVLPTPISLHDPAYGTTWQCDTLYCVAQRLSHPLDYIIRYLLPNGIQRSLDQQTLELYWGAYARLLAFNLLYRGVVGFGSLDERLLAALYDERWQGTAYSYPSSVFVALLRDELALPKFIPRQVLAKAAMAG